MEAGENSGTAMAGLLGILAMEVVGRRLAGAERRPDEQVTVVGEGRLGGAGRR